MKEKNNTTAGKESNSLNGKKTIIVGRVVKAHGIRGEIKVVPLSNVPKRFEYLRDVTIELKNGELLAGNVEYAHFQGKHLILKLHGIVNRDEAENLRGAFVTVIKEHVAPLEDDSYYIFDLECLDVYDITRKKIGRVKRVEQYPANDVIVIEKDRDEMMVPATKEYVKEVDIKAKKIVVDLHDGLPSYPGSMGKK